MDKDNEVASELVKRRKPFSKAMYTHDQLHGVAREAYVRGYADQQTAIALDTANNEVYNCQAEIQRLIQALKEIKKLCYSRAYSNTAIRELVYKTIDNTPTNPKNKTLKELRKAKGFTIDYVNKVMDVARVLSDQTKFKHYSMSHWEECGPQPMFSDRVYALATLYGVTYETIKACPEVE